MREKKNPAKDKVKGGYSTSRSVAMVEMGAETCAFDSRLLLFFGVVDRQPLVFVCRVRAEVAGYLGRKYPLTLN